MCVRIFPHVTNITTQGRRGAIRLLSLLGALLVVPVIMWGSGLPVAEWRLYDRYLRVLPEPQADPRVLIVGIDDRAVGIVGEWPWSRIELAEGLAALAEFSPEHLLLDIELSETSPLLAERATVDAVTAAFPESIPAPILTELLVDRDLFLGRTIAAIGRVVVPVTIEERDTATVRRGIAPIREAAAGEGFSNIEIGPDGVSRRVELTRTVDGETFLQLGVLASGWGPAAPVASAQDAASRAADLVFRSPDGARLTVPRDPEGMLLVRWPSRPFVESYRHISWASLIEYREAMADLRFNLRLMADAGYLDERSAAVMTTANAAEDLLAEARATGRPAVFDEYRRLQQAFVALAGGFLQGGTEERILRELDEIIATAGENDAAREIRAVRDDVVAVFRETREIHAEVERLRRFLEESIRGGIALVGYTATSTIDLGVTPFDRSLPNLGVHAAVLSMFASGDFLDAVPWWVSWIAGIVWSGAVAIALMRLRGRWSLVVGSVAVIAPVIALAVVFRITRVYFPLIPVLLPVVIVTVVLLAMDYLQALRDRQVIRSTFEHYLAPEVISELVAHPERIGVGGREEVLTAMFTDIAGFSRVSEILGTAEVVSLLNKYLTEMSDIVLDHRSTIDKYEGDAIMAFFGAPVPAAEHAEQACRAAIRMKKVETILNDRLVRSGVAPVPLVTRIGINTGPMIVGNLGTTRRLNYTVMGPAVNLASRLEGVNKLYRTSVCISGATYAALPEGFLLRRMDRVRVQGVDRPVRLYELIGYQEESSAPLREALEIFDRGLVAFEGGDWEAALARFETVTRIYPDDGPAALLATRCRAYIAEPPRDTWDGVYALTNK
jgi:adenylate cyclase